jgi:ABC-type polysaccharide/polyol phosphate export permease
MSAHLDAPVAQHGPRMAWLTQLWEHRELVKVLVARDLKVRYKRSVLGFLWTLLNPLITIIIFSLVFSHIFSNFYQQYKLYMFSGVLIWNFFSLTTSQALASLVSNGGTIRKIAVPKIVFPLSVVSSNFLNLIFSFGALAIVFPFAGGHLSLSLIWLIVVLPMLFLFTLGLCFVLSTATVFLRDLKNIWDPLLMIWFFLTPVFYPRSVLPEKYYWLIRFNPMLSILEVCRLPIYLGITPPVGLFLKSIGSAFALLVIGIAIFRKYEDRIIYYL